MSAKYKYDLTGAEPIIKDMFAVNDTYQDGEILAAGILEAGGMASMGVGTGRFIGVSNQGETLPKNTGSSNDGATLTGTQAAGTIQTLKTIVNPFAVYSVEYDTSANITWSAVTDTSVAFADGGTGHPALGGGWAWSAATGELDYVVSSSSAAGTTTLVTVTGTNTASTSGILLYPSGSGLDYNIVLNSNALSINADVVDEGVVGTNAVLGTVLQNVIESTTHGAEILRPRIHNQLSRYNILNSTNNRDNARAFAYVCFFKGSEWNA